MVKLGGLFLILKNNIKLLVSNFACKEFRNCHSVLTCNKAKQTQKPATFLGPIKEERKRQTTASKIREIYRHT